MEIRTGWVAPAALAGGLDHLGIQQPPIRIFSTLLPGITVVTDRVANYSFYPWVSWVHHECSNRIGLDFIHFLRRAECLLTLIAERHALATGEDERFHSQGLIGRRSLARLVRLGGADPIDFRVLAATRSENEGSYFANRYGGLGQYYLAPLRDLGVLQRVTDQIEVSEDIGLPLARAFDDRVDRALFLKVLVQGHTTEGELDSLVSFCPCQLVGNGSERELLLDLVLARKGDVTEPGQLRRQTLLLLLDLSLRRGHDAVVPLDEAFKAACLTGALDSGESWTVARSWQRVVDAWRTYERNDLLSIAVLGVFWIALRQLDERGGVAAHSQEVGAWVTELALETLGELGSYPLVEGIRQIGKRLPPIAHWTHDDHEFQLANHVRRTAEAGREADCLKASVTVLLALASRHRQSYPYVEAGVPADYLRDYPLNLNTFATSVEQEWAGMIVAQWVGELVASWGIEAHLRVALRKLHHESKDTFLVRMTDDGLRRPEDWKEPPLPGFTASRLNRAVQFAVDLGLAKWEVAAGRDRTGEAEPVIDQDEGNRWVARITDYGRSVLEDLGG